MTDGSGPSRSADALVAAVAAGDEGTARELVAAHPELARVRARGASLLRAAAYAGMRALVADLLEAAVDLDVFDAAAVDDTEALQRLLDADPSARDDWSEDGFTPLHLAAFFGQVKATELLLNRGASADVVSRNPMAVRPLNSAAAGSHEVVAHLLLDHGADADAAMAGGYRPLHAAAHNGQTSMVRLLLERGADPHARTDGGETARDVASDPATLALLDSV